MTELPYRHASFFSGIGGFDLGFERAGFRVVSHAEVKPYSCAVLETHWPGIPNLGDINAICPDGEGDHECEIPAADVWSGGFPCSDFSIMGKRKGLLGGRRSSLGLVFLDLVRRHRPPFVVLENVPGLLTSHEGRDLGQLLGVLGDIGYGWSFRLLDARHFGLPQARRRVFVVAAADPRDAGAVLDDTTPRRVDAQTLSGPRGAALAGSRGRPDRSDQIVIGPTYSPRSLLTTRTDGTTFPITPDNYQYVLDEPIVIRREGNFEPTARRDGAAFTILPAVGRGESDDHGQQYVVEPQPIVIRQEGTFDPQLRRDGSAFTVLPAGTGSRSNIGQQYVVEPEPVVLSGIFPKRREQRSPSRRDGVSYTLTPGVIPYVIEPVVDGEWDDLDDVGGGRAAGGGDADRGGAGADGRGTGAAGGDPREGPLRRADDAGASETDHAGRVREAPGLPGRLDGGERLGAVDMGPVHLDSPRWHVLGRTCPVPVVEWIGEGIRTVLDRQRGG